MRLSPAAWFGSLGAGAVGATIAVVLLGTSHSAQQQPIYVLHQDAQTGAAVITSSAPAKPVAPKLAAPTSTVVVQQQPAIQQEAPVPDPSTSAEPSAAPADSNPMNLPPGYPSGPVGNPVGSTEFNPDPSASISPLPSRG